MVYYWYAVCRLIDFLLFPIFLTRIATWEDLAWVSRVSSINYHVPNGFSLVIVSNLPSLEPGLLLRVSKDELAAIYQMAVNWNTC